MVTAADLAEAAAGHFQAGRTEDAAVLYRRLLEEFGAGATAHAGLGAIAVKRGDRQQALTHCRAALAEAGESAPAYADMGGAYALAGQTESAEACFRRALALDAGLVSAAVSLGGLLTEKGDLEAGRQVMEAALLRLAEAGDGAAVRRQRAELAYNLAVNAQAGTQLGRAEALLAWAVAQYPEMPEAHHNLAMLLLERGAVEAACAALDAALLLDPGHPIMLASLCQARLQAGQLDTAETAIRQALQLRDGEPHLLAVLAQLRAAQNRPSEALAALSKAIRSAPDVPIYYVEMARLLVILDRGEAALASVERALEKDRTFLPALAERAALLLGQGRLAEGFQERARLVCAAAGGEAPALPPLQSGTAVTCWLDGPLVEVIDGLRSISDLQQRGAAVTVRCRSVLAPLVRLLPQPVRLEADAGGGARPAEPDIPVAALPHLLGMTAETVAGAIPFLRPPADRVAGWRRHFGAFPKPWIGTAFLSTDVAGRLRPVLNTCGGRLIDLRRGLDDVFGWADLAALIEALDLVIGDDEIALSLAGALGRAGWLLLPRHPHWRWQQGGSSTPFYPSLTLFRQTQAGDWQAPTEAVAAALAGFEAAPAAPVPPRAPSDRYAALASGHAFAPAGMSGEQAEAVGETIRRAEAGMHLLSRGRLAEGWHAYEARWAKHGYGSPDRGLRLPCWQGEPLDGRRLLVWPEQGVGDELQFAALVPRLLALGGRCTLGADPRLVPLFARSFPEAEVIPVDPDRRRLLARQIDPAWFDVFSPAGSLAAVMAPTLADWPRQRAFLIPDAERVAAMTARLDAHGPGLTVGLCWRSGFRTPTRERCYTSLADADALLRLAGVRIVSLQPDDCAVEITAAEDRSGRPILRWSDLDLMDDLDGVAALVACLDLVVAVPTAVAELAAAVGTPVWRPGPAALGWTGLGTACRPWFGAMRPFVGPAAGGTPAALQRVIRHLRDIRPARCRPQL